MVSFQLLHWKRWKLLTQEKPLNSAWSREESCPWTGVRVGCSRVNSSSKLLVSALPFWWWAIGSQNRNPVESRKGASTYDSRKVRRRDALVEHIIEIDIFEERLPLELFCVFFARAKATSRIPCQQLHMWTNMHHKLFRRLTFCKIETASLGIVIGYRGSSSRIASKISSSSSPRNGDCPNNISYVRTPKAHQSTARPYRCSSRICGTHSN